MNTADLILRIRYDYNDIDSDRVEDALIVDYINEALDEIYKLNPELFIKTVVAKLDESDLQQPCCCDLLHSIEAITDSHGNFIAKFKEIDDSASVAFGKKHCTPRDSETRSYNRVNGTDNQFTVKPPVKPDEEVWVRMTCSVKPKPIDLGEELGEAVANNYANIIDYTLFRLFDAETESTTSQAKAMEHYKLFTERVILNQKIKDSFTFDKGSGRLNTQMPKRQ